MRDLTSNEVGSVYGAGGYGYKPQKVEYNKNKHNNSYNNSYKKNESYKPNNKGHNSNQYKPYGYYY